MAEKVCSVCNNLSENCLICGGTNKTKEKRLFNIKICPVCQNQSDYCLICGGNIRLQHSDDDEDDFD